NTRPGRKPICSRNWPVPATPSPPNQSNSFWDPCAASPSPTANRNIKSPKLISINLPKAQYYPSASYFLRYSNLCHKVSLVKLLSFRKPHGLQSSRDEQEGGSSLPGLPESGGAPGASLDRLDPQPLTGQPAPIQRARGGHS